MKVLSDYRGISEERHLDSILKDRASNKNPESFYQIDPTYLEHDAPLMDEAFDYLTVGKCYIRDVKRRAWIKQEYPGLIDRTKDILRDFDRKFKQRG